MDPFVLIQTTFHCPSEPTLFEDPHPGTYLPGICNNVFDAIDHDYLPDVLDVAIEPTLFSEVADSATKWFTELPGPIFEQEPWVFQSEVYVDPYFKGLGLHRYYLDAAGLYRIFDDAEYRFYRSNTAPPGEGDTPFATSTSLPYTPPDTYADGTWYLSLSWYNGLFDSGFLSVGPAGQTYLRIDISGGSEDDSPPDGPLEWRLVLRPGGVVRLYGILYVYDETAGPDEWAVAYTTNGSTPAEDSPDVTEALVPGIGLAILQYDLPAQAHGTTVKVRLQTRRNDGTEGSPDWTYSENSTVKTATADAAGPTTPLDGDRWRGSQIEE